MNDESIFSEALSIQDQKERQLFLNRACADYAQLARINGLILGHNQSNSLLDRNLTGGIEPQESVGSTLDATGVIGEKTNQVVGSYRLLHLLGEGGMGTVYMAEQTQPVKRRVAVKIIKRGMNSDQFVARFEAERQALAMMDHPNIAKVLDAGCTDEGLPFFVMELVKGIPITEFCDQNKLATDERLELFIQVCNAVQHAHQKGIIHRDLKPSNVMVAMYDDRPVPKVIDFGVAKATHQQLTEQTLYTVPGQIVGTWEYMSPEQAILNQLDVDTRTDVYSLGVILYELLTGHTPLDLKSLGSGALEERLRRIREQEPSRPSLRISSLGAAAGSLSTYRGSDAKSLTQTLRGDLDWIVMKALEKDRSRRYETASGFAAEVRRFLDDEPISFRPPSSWDQLGRVYRKNRVIANAALFSIAALAIGFAFAVWQYSIATHRSNELAEKELELRAQNQEIAKEKERTEEHLASLSRLFMREVQSLALQGDYAEAERRLGAASQHGIGEDTQKLLQAQIELHRGNFSATIGLLEPLRTPSGENSVTVDSMLALAYQRAGLEALHLELISETANRNCSSFSDHLYRGYALNTFFPFDALEDLKKARTQDRTSHMAMLIHGETQYMVGENEKEPAAALNALREGIKKLEAIQVFLPENNVARNGIAAATYHCSKRYAELGQHELASRYAEEAKTLFGRLPTDSPTSLATRAAYFFAEEMYDELFHDYELSQKNGLTHNHQAIAVTAGMYKHGKKEAEQVLAQTDVAFAESTAAMQIYAQFGNIKTEARLEQLVSEGIRNRREIPLVLSIFDWTLYRLINDEEGMKRSTKGLENLSKVLQEDDWLLHVDFMRGERETAEPIIQKSANRFNQGYALFYAGFDALARGRRAEAKDCFQRMIETKKFESHGVMWAHAFLDDLDDPNWLPWLNESLEESSGEAGMLE